MSEVQKVEGWVASITFAPRTPFITVTFEGGGTIGIQDSVVITPEGKGNADFRVNGEAMTGFDAMFELYLAASTQTEKSFWAIVYRDPQLYGASRRVEFEIKDRP